MPELFWDGIYMSDLFRDGIYMSDLYRDGICMSNLYRDGIYMSDLFRDGIYMSDLFCAVRGQSTHVLPPLVYTLRQWSQALPFTQKYVFRDYISNFMMLNITVFFLQAKRNNLLKPLRFQNLAQKN